METEDVKRYAGLDWKAIGCLTSIVSAFFLGIVSRPTPSDPWWVLPALIAGMASSVLGMGFRYRAHIQDRKEIAQARWHPKRR